MITVGGADHFFIGLADRVGDAVAAFLVEGARAV